MSTVDLSAPAEEPFGACSRLCGPAWIRGRQDQPSDPGVRTLGHEARDHAAGPDLRVVGMCTGHEDPRTAVRWQAKTLSQLSIAHQSCAAAALGRSGVRITVSRLGDSHGA